MQQTTKNLEAGRRFSDVEIAPCLHHQPTKDANGKPLPAVRHYNHAQRKTCWTSAARCIVGPPSRAGSSVSRCKRKPSIRNSVSRRDLKSPPWLVSTAAFLFAARGGGGSVSGATL